MFQITNRHSSFSCTSTFHSSPTCSEETGGSLFPRSHSALWMAFILVKLIKSWNFYFVENSEILQDSFKQNEDLKKKKNHTFTVKQNIPKAILWLCIFYNCSMNIATWCKTQNCVVEDKYSTLWE